MILFEGAGDSIADPVVVIGAKNSIEGVSSEYDYLQQRFGEKDKDWFFISQKLLNENEKFYDKLTLELKDKSKIDIYFDISAFFHKGLNI
jgi:hypothetical protein